MTVPYRVLVTGSRDWQSRVAVYAALDRIAYAVAPRPVVIVHGHCPSGADRFADDWTRNTDTDATVERWPADWSQGRKAGPDRNAAMVATGADEAVAFIRNRSRGATHCAGLAEKAGIPTKRVTA